MTTDAPTTAHVAATRTPSLRTQGWAIVTAGFGQNVILTTVTTFILVYLVQYAKLNTAAVGAVTVILTVARVIDAVSDPVMGSIIDRTRTRWGKLRPFILFSAAPVALLTALMFTVPDISQVGKVAYFAVVYVLWGVSYTVCDVPFWGLIGSAFPDPGTRARVVSNVRAFGAISLGLATLGLPWLALFASFSSTTRAHGWSISVAAVSLEGMALYLLAFVFGRERPTSTTSARLSFRQLFGQLFGNRPLLLILIGSVLGFGRQIVQAGGALFVIIAYGNEGAFTLIGGALIVGVIVASFSTAALLSRMSPRTIAIASSLFGAVVAGGFYLVGYQNIVIVMVAVFLTGYSIGVFSVVQTTMIADAVDAAEARTGVRSEGISFATLTFSGKIMSAAAVLVFGLFVVIAGYHAGVHITPAMRQTIFVSFTIVPLVSCLASAVPFFFYRLDRSGTAGVAGTPSGTGGASSTDGVAGTPMGSGDVAPTTEVAG